MPAAWVKACCSCFRGFDIRVPLGLPEGTANVRIRTLVRHGHVERVQRNGDETIQAHEIGEFGRAVLTELLDGRAIGQLRRVGWSRHMSVVRGDECPDWTRLET